MDLSRIIGILSLVATVLTFAGTYLVGVIPESYAVIMLAASAAINAFTARVQGVVDEPKKDED
jgi:uncharacterized phage infection (PIP) family protein YhgE